MMLDMTDSERFGHRCPKCKLRCNCPSMIGECHHVCHDKPLGPMKRIIRWEYRSNNRDWGYDAILECGHKRIDLTNERHARNARCWNCEPEEKK